MDKDKLTKMPINIDDWKYPPGVTISSMVIEEIITTLRHARVFITSREKMHPDGAKLYDDLVDNLAGEFAVWKGTKQAHAEVALRDQHTRDTIREGAIADEWVRIAAIIMKQKTLLDLEKVELIEQIEKE